MSLFDIVRQIGVVAGAIGAITFPIYYHLTAPEWWRKEMGRFLMLGGVGWASLYMSGILGIFFPSEIFREITRAVLIIGAGSFAWYQVILYRRVRLQTLRDRAERSRDESQ